MLAPPWHDMLAGLFNFCNLRKANTHSPTNIVSIYKKNTYFSTLAHNMNRSPSKSRLGLSILGGWALNREFIIHILQPLRAHDRPAGPPPRRIKSCIDPDKNRDMKGRVNLLPYLSMYTFLLLLLYCYCGKASHRSAATAYLIARRLLSLYDRGHCKFQKQKSDGRITVYILMDIWWLLGMFMFCRRWNINGFHFMRANAMANRNHWNRSWKNWSASLQANVWEVPALIFFIV